MEIVGKHVKTDKKRGKWLESGEFRWETVGISDILEKVEELERRQMA